MIPDMLLLALFDTWDTATRQWATSLGWPLEGALRLILAALAGGLVGLEREVRGRQAGFRTHLLVCLGSALVMIVSIHFGKIDWGAHPPGYNVNVDPARIAYGVMTGVGFLGAGTILQHKGTIRGLTTAAAMWCVAAIGLAVGFGMYLMAAFATFLVVMALWFLDYFENLLPKAKYRTLTVRMNYHPACIDEIVQKVNRRSVNVVDVSFDRLREDLSKADVQLHVVYWSKDVYMTLQREVENDERYSLMSTRES